MTQMIDKNFRQFHDLSKEIAGLFHSKKFNELVYGIMDSDANLDRYKGNSAVATQNHGPIKFIEELQEQLPKNKFIRNRELEVAIGKGSSYVRFCVKSPWGSKVCFTITKE